ncbi:MAG: hypothetical protein NTV34_21595, partial [Proteobacteria bacterium]|nr:hypothetical protein [Pseudomonadota bacterium]
MFVERREEPSLNRVNLTHASRRAQYHETKLPKLIGYTRIGLKMYLGLKRQKRPFENPSDLLKSPLREIRSEGSARGLPF